MTAPTDQTAARTARVARGGEAIADAMTLEAVAQAMRELEGMAPEELLAAGEYGLALLGLDRGDLAAVDALIEEHRDYLAALLAGGWGGVADDELEDDR